MKIKEFFKRWKEGIQKVTPMQMVRINLIGIGLIIAGVILGLVTTFVLKLWWLFTILLGSLFLTTMNLIGTLQKYFTLKKINEMMEVKNGI